MEAKAYWNSVSDTKNFATPFQIDEFQKFVRQDAIILDVGCGYGRTLNELKQYGYHNLIGIDFSEGMIRRGRKEFPELDLRVKESDTIELPDCSVDAVILFAVLTCIISNTEQQYLINEIQRVLKPGGILYINDFLLNTDERNITRYNASASKYNTYGVFELPEGAIVRHHSEDWIKELLESFSDKEYERLTFTTMNGNKSNGFFYIGSKR